MMKEEFSTSHSTLGRYFIDWFEKFENNVDGSDSWFETSGCGLTEYWECEGNLLLSWKSGGYRKVLDLLMVRPYLCSVCFFGIPLFVVLFIWYSYPVVMLHLSAGSVLVFNCYV
jgi:hypothetical protein